MLAARLGQSTSMTSLILSIDEVRSCATADDAYGCNTELREL